MAGFEATHWEGVFLPAGAPADLVLKVQQAFAAVLRQEAVAKQLLDLGIDPVGNSTDEFKVFLQEDRARFAKMFTFTGLKPE